MALYALKKNVQVYVVKNETLSYRWKPEFRHYLLVFFRMRMSKEKLENTFLLWYFFRMSKVWLLRERVFEMMPLLASLHVILNIYLF